MLMTYPELYQMYMDYLEENAWGPEPNGLYQPANYMMHLGGKRMRPVAVLMAGQLFGGYSGNCLPLAHAVEVFHNFTLVHDDVMDEAPLRRNQPTVHTKWNLNTAILSGDVMLVKAYESLISFPFSDMETTKNAISVFNKAAIGVCEGQQMDMDFETGIQVSIEDYLKMIELKTAVLLAAAFQLGAIGANADSEDAQHMYDFGLNLGISFQLQDDFLDAFGDPKKFGKQVGGDIIRKKKTYLYLKALELANLKDKEILENIFKSSTVTPDEVNLVLDIFERNGVKSATKIIQEAYYQKALNALGQAKLGDEQVNYLKDWGILLMGREH
jgi:geranylgeranyl diphosphate synthase, type II